jgi:hypothetical protein
MDMKDMCSEVMSLDPTSYEAQVTYTFFQHFSSTQYLLFLYYLAAISVR